MKDNLNKMELQGGILGIGKYQIPLSAFPCLFVAYASSTPLFMKRHFRLEQQGDKWREHGITDDDVEEFISDVCAWGGVSRVLGMIRENDDAAVVKAFHNALKLAQDGKQGQAVDVLQGLNGMRISVASKQLRMMSSHNCVVLDSILQEVLPYEATPTDYEGFCNDCGRVVKTLNHEGIEFPQKALKQICHEYGIAEATIRSEWRAADVEAVIFYRV